MTKFEDVTKKTGIEETGEKTTQATGAEETGEETTQETDVPQKPEKKEKLFTQEEVNSFIQSRLAQMKKQAAKESTAEIEQRIKELDAREMKLSVREELEKRGMPAELAEVIECASVEEIGTKLDRLNEIYSKKKEESKASKGFQVGGGGNEGQRHDAIREAMGLYR